MIAYEVLVQTIADWKAGVRPSAPTPPRTLVGAPQPVDELSSGVVDLDDDESFAAEEYEEGGYDEAQYQQPVETYDDDDEV